MLIGRYDPSLVLVSVLVAVFASFTALSVAGRVKQSRGYGSLAWTAGGAIAMGSGIWAMHFIGMLAFSLPITLGYDLWLTLLSLLLPIVVCGMALWQLREPELARSQLASSSILMGIGINAMHYTGMAAMRMEPGIVYDPWLFALSVAIAIASSFGALWIAFRLRQGAVGAGSVQAAAAVVMGFAIAGMHYTGMAAAGFPAGSVCSAATGWISQHNLALIVTVVIVGMLLVALLVSVYDARLEARAASLYASMQIAEQRKHLYLHELEARVEAERLNQLKDEFLSTVSHELRTPLNAILGWSQLLSQKGPVSDVMLRKGLETIERNARAQVQLIDDLLDMSRILSGKVRLDLQPAWPAEIVGAVVESLRPTALAKRIRLEAELDAAAGPVLADGGRLQQVMWNLVSNAVKFTQTGGEVRVSMRREGEQLAIAIVDNGAGIKADFLAHVFDRFRQADTSTTRQHGGLGLGLSIVRQLVELHGGTVGVESAGEGQGATFTVRIPLQPALPPRDVASDTPRGDDGVTPVRAQADLAGLTILALDDEPDSLEVVQEILSATGARVIAARNPLEALRVLEEERPQLLISDIGMPGLDGFELIRRVRALADPKLAAMPALALSAFARKEDRQRAVECGFTDYLVKPVTPALLVDAAAALLDDAARRRTAGQGA
ncbi:MHYT domain-containing protein [Massilia sp. Se16.2.3]|uniref:hybrid sensor histidine kinase/response regulator n=1 Tax=Massilia sp. Se16.2.3 TaxID=2709303 RepID=UPI001E49F911|nr:MHYT domain-containing protein [Massilia sp. Se16.2.3]